MVMWLQQLQSLSDRAKGGDGNSMIGWQVGRTNAVAAANRPQALSSRGVIVPASPTATNTDLNTSSGESPALSLPSEEDSSADYLLEASGDNLGIILGQAQAVSAMDAAVPSLTLKDMQAKRKERRKKQLEGGGSISIADKRGKEESEGLERRLVLEQTRNASLWGAEGESPQCLAKMARGRGGERQRRRRTLTVATPRTSTMMRMEMKMRMRMLL